MKLKFSTFKGNEEFVYDFKSQKLNELNHSKDIISFNDASINICSNKVGEILTLNISGKVNLTLKSAYTFKPFEFSRHSMGDNDILIEIMYAGICHSDIHSARSEWHEGIYPMVPGHEIAGKVVAVGKNVTKFQVGDYAGVDRRHDERRRRSPL